MQRPRARMFAATYARTLHTALGRRRGASESHKYTFCCSRSATLGALRTVPRTRERRASKATPSRWGPRFQFPSSGNGDSPVSHSSRRPAGRLLRNRETGIQQVPPGKRGFPGPFPIPGLIGKWAVSRPRPRQIVAEIGNQQQWQLRGVHTVAGPGCGPAGAGGTGVTGGDLGICPQGRVAELPSNLRVARGLSGRRDSGPRMGGTLSTHVGGTFKLGTY